MISKLKKFVLFITATLFVGTSSVFANDINQQTTDPVNINQDNTTINFTDQGCINYTNTSNLPGTISIDNNSANDISNLTINVENSSFSKWWGTHVTSSSEGGLDSYAIDLSNAKSGFRLNFAGKQDSAGQNSTGTYFRANSNISDSEDNNPKSAVIYLPEAVSNDVNDRTMVNFGTINANLESNIQKIASYDPCASTTIGIPILNTAGANNISLQKDQSNSGSTFSSQASATEFDEVDSTVFGCGKISTSGLSEGAECNQLCNFDLSNFDLSKDSATSTSPRYAAVIGAARVSANDGAKNVKINQFNNLHVKNTPKTATSTAGIEGSAYAVVIGGGYVDANLTHGADNNGSCKISQFNDITIDTISGTLEAKAVGNDNNNSAAVVGCAKLSTTIGDPEGDPIENGHVGQFNNMSIGEISLPSGENTFFNITSLNSSSNSYASVIGSANDELTIYQNATNSTVEKFNNLKIGNMSGKLNAAGNKCTAVIGSADETFTINAANSIIEEFNSLGVGEISGELNANAIGQNFPDDNPSSSVVLGSGYSSYTLNGSGSEVQRFNDVTIGSINDGVKLIGNSSLDCVAVIGSADETFTINAANSIIEEFNGLGVGEISGELNANATGENSSEDNPSSSVVLGSGYSSYTLNGSGSEVQRFNDVTIESINNGAKLIGNSSLDCVAVIGSADETFIIGAADSTIEEFNNLKVGTGENAGISGKLNATSGNNALIIGVGRSEYTLNGSEHMLDEVVGSSVKRFNNVIIGDINDGANLISQSDCCAAVIGIASELIKPNNIKSTNESFNNLEIGNIAGNLSAECSYPDMSSAVVIGQGDFIVRIPRGDIVEERFNNMTVGNIASSANLISSSVDGSAIIGNAYEELNVGENVEKFSAKIFNDLTIGDIYGSLNATGTNSATVLGSGYSDYILDGGSEVQRFNNVTIGDITGIAKSNSEHGDVAVTGIAGESFNINAPNSIINEFNNLKVEKISGELNAGAHSNASVIGLGESWNMLRGSDSKVQRFNNVTIGDIADRAKLSSTSNSHATVIGNADEYFIIRAENSMIKEFNRLEVGKISGELNTSGHNYATVLGSGRSRHNLEVGNSNIQKFNEVTIGNIDCGAKLSSSTSESGCSAVIGNAYETLTVKQDNSVIEEFNNLKVGNIFNPSISSSSGDCATIIGSAGTLVTIDKTAEGSIIKQFDNLEVGNISGSTDESSNDSYIAKSGYASIIGIANSELNLSGNSNNIKFFNDAKIGDITKGSFIKSEANETRDVSISTVIGCTNVSAVIDENTNGSAVELFNGLEVKDISGTMYSGYYGGYNVCSKYASVIGMANSDFKLNGQENLINFFNDVSIGNITNDSVIKAGANENKELSSSILIGSANTSITINDASKDSIIELFTNLRIGNISGNLGSGYDGSYNVKSKCASIIGAASSEFTMSGEDNHINFFNDVSIGNITNDSVIKAGANENKELSSSILIGSANTSITINDASKDSIIELFTNLRIGNISGNLGSGYDGSYNVKSKCASIIGAASSEFTMSGEDNHINFFNDVSIGNIISAARIDDFTHEKKAPIKSGASLYTTVIGNAHDSVTVDESANGSTINIFDNLKIGDISTYEINAGYDSTDYIDIKSPNTSIVGTAFSKLIINGKNNKINYFNDVNIGNIEGSILRSGATECATVVGCANIDIAANSNSVDSEINLFNNLVIGDASGCVLKVGLEHGYGSVIGCAKFVCNDTSKIKIFSNVSSQFQGNTTISSFSKNGDLLLNTLGGQRNGYYGGENNNIADGMRFYFNGIDNDNLGNDIVVTALQQSGSNYYLRDNCRAFSVGPNFQINVGRKRILDNLTGSETENSVTNGGVKSDCAGILRILGDVGKAPYNDSCENSVMRVDGGWDAQCFGRISDLRNIDIIEGSLSLMGTSNSAKAELETAIKQVDEYGCFPNYEDRKPNGSLTLAEGQTLCFGVSSEIVDNEINERFGNDNGAFKTVNGKLLMRNDGLNDQNVLSLKGGKLSVADTSSSTVSPNACFYVIRADVPHDEKTNGNLINIDPNLYKISDENFNTNQILGNVSMYKITDTQDQSIVTGIKGALAKKELNAYKAYDTDEKNIGIVIVSGEDKPDDPDYGTDDPDPSQDHGSDINDPSQDPEPGPEPDQGSEDSDHHQLGPIGPTSYIDVEPDPDPIPGPHIIIGGDDAIDLDVIDLISKSNTNVVVAQGIADTISSVVGSALDVDTHSNYGFDGDFLHREDNDYLASIIRGESRVRYIGGGNYSMASQYKTRYSLNPKLFFSPFGEHGHQDKVSDLGYNYNLYGFTVGGRLAKYLQSGASIKFGIFGSVSDNTTKYCGEKSHLGMRNNQKMYFGGVFGSYEDYDISDFRTNLSIVIGGGRFKNKTWTRITNGGKVRAKFNSSDFHASADFVKNMINIGNSGFHCGPWVALSYNHIHENGHNVVCNGENVAAVSSTRFDFLDTTLGINFEKNISYSPERNISGRIFAKAGWFCRPVRSHSSCTIRADGVDPVNSEFRFSDRNAAIVSGGFKFEFNKKWELSVGITSRIAKHHWLINGNALIGYSF